MNEKNSNNILVEVCVDSVESAIAAQEGGAARIELCSDLAVGGITPSAGTIVLARKQVQIGLHVIIRPRGGDFCYSELEFNTMQRDILVAKKFGADGVVFGILKSDNAVDVERTCVLVELARPMSITFHRAFDIVTDPLQSLEDIIQLGIDRILTSGQAATTMEGIDLISRLVQKANGRIIIMPASGINQHNIRTIIEHTGVKEIHVGKAVTRQVEHPVADMFSTERSVVDAHKVRELVEAISSIHVIA
jgi:copper homeostasis protein